VKEIQEETNNDDENGKEMTVKTSNSTKVVPVKKSRNSEMEEAAAKAWDK